VTVTGKRGWAVEDEESGVVVLGPKVTMSTLRTSSAFEFEPICDKSSLGGRGGGTPVTRNA